MRPLDYLHLRANFFSYALLYLLKVRTGKADRIALADAGGNDYRLCSPINHHLCPGNGSLPRASAAGDEADDLHRASL